MFKLTKAEIAVLPVEAFTGVEVLKTAISVRYGVGVSDETALRILADFRK